MLLNDFSYLADPRRLDAVRSSALLDLQQPEKKLDLLTRRAAQATGVTAAFLSVVTDRADFYISHYGFPSELAETSRLEGRTFCHAVVGARRLLVIDDSLRHPAFSDIPTVQSLGVRAYVGTPIFGTADEVIGAFCVIDNRARDWSHRELSLIEHLADRAQREASDVRGIRSGDVVGGHSDDVENASTSPLLSTDVEWLAGASAAGLEEAYAAHAAVVYALALQIAGDEAIAARLLRKTFLDAATSGSRDLTLPSLVARARRLALIASRAAGRRVPPLSRCPVGVTHEEWRVLQLAYFNGFSCSQIAMETGENESVIRDRLIGAMKKLRYAAGRR